MRKIQALVISLVCGVALAASAAALARQPQNSNQTSESCCDMKDCCKADMSCCKKKRKGKNAHACCKGKDAAASCCCKGDACPMPNKKPAGNTNSN